MSPDRAPYAPEFLAKFGLTSAEVRAELSKIEKEKAAQLTQKQRDEENLVKRGTGATPGVAMPFFTFDTRNPFPSALPSSSGAASSGEQYQTSKGLGASRWSQDPDLMERYLDRDDKVQSARIKRENEQVQKIAEERGLSVAELKAEVNPFRQRYTQTAGDGQGNRLPTSVTYSTIGGLGSTAAPTPITQALLDEKDEEIRRLRAEAREREFPAPPTPQGNVAYDSELRPINLPFRPGTVGTNCKVPPKQTTQQKTAQQQTAQHGARDQQRRRHRGDRPFVRPYKRIQGISTYDSENMNKPFMDEVWERYIVPLVTPQQGTYNWEVKVLYEHAEYLDVDIYRLYNLIYPIRIHTWLDADEMLHVGLLVRKENSEESATERVQLLMMEYYRILLTWSEEVREQPHPKSLVQLVVDWLHGRVKYLYIGDAEMPVLGADKEGGDEAAQDDKISEAKAEDKPQEQAQEQAEEGHKSAEAKPEQQAEDKPAVETAAVEEAGSTAASSQVDHEGLAELRAELGEGAVDKVLNTLFGLKSAGMWGDTDSGTAPKGTAPAKPESEKAATEPAKKVTEDAAKKVAEDAAKKVSEDAANKAATDATKKATEDAAKGAAEDAAKKASIDAAKKDLAVREIKDYVDALMGREKSDGVRRNIMIKYIQNWPQDSCMSPDEVAHVLHGQYHAHGSLYPEDAGKKEKKGADDFLKSYEDKKKQWAREAREQERKKKEEEGKQAYILLQEKPA